MGHWRRDHCRVALKVSCMPVPKRTIYSPESSSDESPFKPPHFHPTEGLRCTRHISGEAREVSGGAHPILPAFLCPFIVYCSWAKATAEVHRQATASPASATLKAEGSSTPLSLPSVHIPCRSQGGNTIGSKSSLISSLLKTLPWLLTALRIKLAPWPGIQGSS